MIASIDGNVGRILDWLDWENLAENTVVTYTSDQGFFLGDHGWYDKRFMYEESLRMPFIIRYPGEVRAQSECKDMVLNVDFPSLILDLAGAEIPEDFQGRSFRAQLRGVKAADWRISFYYRYWMHKAHHNVYADPDYAAVVRQLKDELYRLQDEVGDQRYSLDTT